MLAMHKKSVDLMQSAMEVIALRFSHLSEGIFNSLDNESIAKCRKVNRFWLNYLDNQKFVQIRKIKATIIQFHAVGEAWMKVFHKASTETIMDLGVAVSQFYKKDPNLTYHEGVTPLYVAAGIGQLKLFQTIRDKTHEKHGRPDEFLHIRQDDLSSNFST